MVKITDIKYYDHTTKEVMCSVFADTKGEVGSADVIGLKEGYTIAPGSDIVTASLEVGLMKSTGQWQW